MYIWNYLFRGSANLLCENAPRELARCCNVVPVSRSLSWGPGAELYLEYLNFFFFFFFFFF